MPISEDQVNLTEGASDFVRRRTREESFARGFARIETYTLLDTPEGRQHLAASMINPIARSMDYQAVGRRLLMVDELPQGDLASYAWDYDSRMRLATEENTHYDHLFFVQKYNLEKLKENANKNKTAISWLFV